MESSSWDVSSWTSPSESSLPSMTGSGTYFVSCSVEMPLSDDCEKVTKALLADHSWENGLDIQSLEVSSPGVNDVLEHDRAFEAFRSFPVVVTFKEPHPTHGLNLQGNLVDRDETFVRVRRGGRVFKLERASVQEVRLVPAEDGDNL
ncbi:hypothetical protein F1559_004449 [Cyanidiococcus yangmingshanensis]|uniref:Uncharacterized protein n=1 Tax=Cyanidiococcus yangmingshanensis TaxID=2690220 RepID=A0A7J7IS02_9RHOD|nr:hypothetical protein F1559_004449 [Cyanidiococcus yangmingshanensis]